MASIQFIMSCAFSIIPPLLPLLLPSFGVHDAAMLRMWAGAIIGVAPLGAALMSPAWGRLSDRLDRRWIILMSCAAVAVCTSFMSAASRPSELLALRFGMGLFGGHVAAGLGVMAAVTPNNRLGYALGWLATAQLAGTLLGPLLGGVIADIFHSLRAPFFGASVATVFVAALIARVPAQSPAKTADTGVKAEPAAADFSPEAIGTWIAVLLLAQYAITSPQPIISLRVLELEGARQNVATLAGVAFSVVALSGLIGSPSIGRLGDVIGSRRALILCLSCAAVLTLPQGFAARYDLFVGERFVAGLFLAGIVPTVNAFIGRNTSAGIRGRTYGLTASATFMGAFLGPFCGGAIAAHFGFSAVFVISACMLLAAAVWIAAWATRS